MQTAEKRAASLRKYNNSDARKAVMKADYLKRRHGLTVEQFEAIWRAQSGCCYLCEKPMANGEHAIDHDHACCPDQKSCDNCRRGIAHRACNAYIGQFGDDPELLERIAANLRAARKVG